ncbi:MULTISPECIES: hypothetical protein [Rhodococcus]|uniref:Uncharacterized protein n=1 Tax=Rhodococcus globerulus TaxID=33008 RepID=A0ABU4BQW6_RHOGO|nr:MULTISPECIES: hypothetical protein [Rhodococcus]MDV6266615.1 hypothetical protein [Rhodococcus globerulus]
MSAQQNTRGRAAPATTRRTGATPTTGTARSSRAGGSATRGVSATSRSARTSKASPRLGWGSSQALAARQATADSTTVASRRGLPRREEPTRRSKRAEPTRRSKPRQSQQGATVAPEDVSTGTDRGPVWRSVEAALEWLKTHTHLADSVQDRVGAVTSKLQERMKTFVEGATPHGPAVTAGLAGVRAVLTGKNPVLPAVKGMVSGLSGKTKVMLVLLFALALLLGPVLLVVLVLALIVAGVIAAVRAAAK